MNVLLALLSVLVAVLSLVCTIIIVVDAFRDAIFKGILCLIGCGIYFFWYALFEFEHDNKWIIVIGSLGGGTIATGIASLIR